MAKRSLDTVLRIAGCVALSLAILVAVIASAQDSSAGRTALDHELEAVLHREDFTGTIEYTLKARLGRPLDRQLADVGRLLWFDTITGLNNDNTCGGCHSPTHGFGDTQSIAIGIENNAVVGPHRTGPRNMRRSPMVLNTAFFPTLMWNSRFAALSGDPFDNGAGYAFPPPEGPLLSYLPHLLTAQAFIPPTERTEVTGFDFHGDSVAIRSEVLNRLNQTPAYRERFGQVFPEVKAGAQISFDMFAAAIAEFEFTLTFANAPIDQFARGERNALSESEKQGALLFFGAARCSICHSVSGRSNEMFSDFRDYVIGVPQIMPELTNNAFDGPGSNEDFGREQVTGNPLDRYKFRTAPLRNVCVQAAFMHNGAYTSLEDAVRHHLNVVDSARHYSPSSQRLPADLSGPMGPIAPVLARVDPLLISPITLTEAQVDQLVDFVCDGLLDPRAEPDYLRTLIPESVPSGRPVLRFEFP